MTIKPRRPARALFVGPLPPTRTGGTLSRGQLVTGWAAAGVKVFALAPMTEQGLADGDLFAAGNPSVPVVKYHAPRALRIGQDKYLDFEGLQAEADHVAPIFAEMVRSFRPDLVVAGREDLSLYLPRMAHRLGIPILLMMRGNPTAQILAESFDGGAAERYLEAYRQCDRLVAVSRHLADGLGRRGIDADCVENAIDLERFRPRPKDPDLMARIGADDSDLVVLVPMNLAREKRVRDALHVAKRTLPREPRLLFVSAGGGPRLEELEAERDALGLGRRFQFLGWQEPDSMPDWTNLADIVLHPSATEGMARTYLEALACEKCLVASSIPASRELIHDGENGLLFSVGDVDAAADVVLKAAADPGMRTRLGGAGRRSIAGRSLDAAASRYVELFETIVSAKRPVASIRSGTRSANTGSPTGRW